jgi:biotin operon repressor
MDNKIKEKLKLKLILAKPKFVKLISLVSDLNEVKKDLNDFLLSEAIKELKEQGVKIETNLNNNK